MFSETERLHKKNFFFLVFSVSTSSCTLLCYVVFLLCYVSVVDCCYTVVLRLYMALFYLHLGRYKKQFRSPVGSVYVGLTNKVQSSWVKSSSSHFFFSKTMQSTPKFCSKIIIKKIIPIKMNVKTFRKWWFILKNFHQYCFCKNDAENLFKKHKTFVMTDCKKKPLWQFICYCNVQMQLYRENVWLN